MLNEEEYVDVFLVSGSPEERNKYVEDIITIEEPDIVLCSMQYNEDVDKTINWFIHHDYFLFIHWLNPGYNDKVKNEDKLNLIDKILKNNSLIGMRDGMDIADKRVQEIKDFIYGWAKSRNLLKNIN